MQTYWDMAQQIIRILLYAGAGALVNLGLIDESTGTALAGALLGLVTGAWTFYWNKASVATVEGLKASDAPGTTAAAVAIETVKAKA
jgi:hypothetical protein